MSQPGLLGVNVLLNSKWSREKTLQFAQLHYTVVAFHVNVTNAINLGEYLYIGIRYWLDGKFVVLCVEITFVETLWARGIVADLLLCYCNSFYKQQSNASAYTQITIAKLIHTPMHQAENA